MSMRFRFERHLSRRNLLVSAGLSAASLLTGCSGVGLPATIYTPPSAAPVPTRGRGMATQIGPNRFRVECKGFEPVESQQRSSEWCWAACAQMIRQYHGERVSQEEIASRIRGAEDRQTATVDEIMLAMNPDMIRDWTRLRGKNQITITPGYWLGAEIRKRTITTDLFIDELSDGSPLVVGTRDGAGGGAGHACVAYAAEYSRTDVDFLDVFRGRKGSIVDTFVTRYDIHQVDVFDPWPVAGGKTTLDAASVQSNLDFLISKRESRTILAEGLKAIR